MESDVDLKTIRITVSGKVQGVWYRKYTQQKAKDLRLKGYVRNKGNGEVECIATGIEEDLNALVQWCKKGPPLALVKQCTVEEVSLIEFEDFVIGT
ncbi:MAG TPA: acylphosphatase [Bacteroidia bacterium]|nr:acylphosphatase [Bacteroidia bacterium]